MPKAAIFCKASISDGLGHIYRQVVLACELIKQGWEISFYIPRYEPAVDLLTQAGFIPTLVDSEIIISEYFNNFFDLTVLDIQDTAESLIYSIRKFSTRIASFEDLGPGRNLVDMLIDCNLAPSTSKNISPNTRALLGTNYSILHPDFADYHERTREFNVSPKSALITMGATDPKGLALPLTQLLLEEKKDLQLTVLTGFDTRSTSEFHALASKFESLNLRGPESRMAKTLWDHEVVICSGGVTLHEAIAVGTPAFVINQVEHQQSKARFIEKHGAAINLGIGSQYDIKKLRKALSLGKPELQSMSSKGKKLIDGRGVFRVSKAICELVKK